MSRDKTDILRRIALLFTFGSDKRNHSEHESLLAITRARELMLKHQVQEWEVQQTLNRRAEKTKSEAVVVGVHRAYVRKMTNFAKYDENVALCVQYLTSTRAVIKHSRGMDGSHYVAMEFAGAEGDVAVACHLFMILLKEVRARAADTYGRGKNVWGKKHTSYALGFSARMIERAKAQLPTDAVHGESLALMLRDKSAALADFMQRYAPRINKRKSSDIDPFAYLHGHADGADISLEKKGVS